MSWQVIQALLLRVATSIAVAVIQAIRLLQYSRMKHDIIVGGSILLGQSYNPLFNEAALQNHDHKLTSQMHDL